MNFSFQTVLMAILGSNILIACMTLIFSNTKLMLRLGYKLLLLGTGLIILRLLTPFEFPFTRNIDLAHGLGFIITRINSPFYHQIALKHILLTLWGIGIIRHFYVYIQECQRMQIFVATNGRNVTHTPKYQSILSHINNTAHPVKSVRIYETAHIESPMICGIIHPCILLPSTLVLTDQELKLVLQHELSHYYHKDLLLKCILRILCIIYWWNPLCKILQKQVDTILEIRIDHEITAYERETKQNYFSCLLNVAKHSLESSASCPLAIHYCKSSHSLLHYRIEMGLQSAAPHRISYLLTSLCLVLILSFSYCFIFESLYVPPEIAATYIAPSSPDFYYILDDNGIYHIYFEGEFIETTDSLEYYHKIRSYEEWLDYHENK